MGINLRTLDAEASICAIIISHGGGVCVACGWWLTMISTAIGMQMECLVDICHGACDEKYGFVSQWGSHWILQDDYPGIQSETKLFNFYNLITSCGNYTS